MWVALYSVVTLEGCGIMNEYCASFGLLILFIQFYLYYTTLYTIYYAILYYARLCYTVLFYVDTILYDAMLYYTM